MTPSRIRCRTRVISRLIEAHRAEFDALVAEERAHAEAWQRRLDASAEAPTLPVSLVEPKQLSLSISRSRPTGADRREARRRRVLAMWKVGATLDEMAEAANCSKRTIERITAAEGLRYGRGSSRRKVGVEERRQTA